MENIERLKKVIFDVADEINQQLPKDQQLEKPVDAIMFGKLSKLDSLCLVNLIVLKEQKIEEEFGVTMTIADERVMLQKKSPFKNY